MSDPNDKLELKKQKPDPAATGTGEPPDAGTGEPPDAGTGEPPATGTGQLIATTVQIVPETGVVIIHTRGATDPAEQALEARLREGDATPQEALAWFRTHGFPQLTDLPHFVPNFDGEIGIWLFPDTAEAGTGPTGFGVGAPSSTETVATGSDQAGGHGTSRTSPPDPSHLIPPGSGGLSFGPGSVDSGRTVSGGAGSVGTTPAGAGTSGEAGSVGTTPAGAGTSGEAGSAVAPPSSHFAADQLAGALRDREDAAAPRVARIALDLLLPATYVAALLERHVLNPLLAAPAHVDAAILLELQAAQAVANGDLQAAIDDDRAAADHFKQAAMAILAVVPLGEGVAAVQPARLRLAEVGVEFLDFRNLPRNVETKKWVLDQMWVTGSPWDMGFRLSGDTEVWVDGFVNKTGLDYVDRASNMVLVEVKTADRIRSAMGSGDFATEMGFKLGEQFNNYVDLGQRLGVSGVRYVVTESAEGVPMTTALRELLRRTRPDLFDSGFVEVVSTPPAPPSFTGYWPGESVLQQAARVL